MGRHCSGVLSFRCLGREQDEKEKWMRCMGKRVLHCGWGGLQLLWQPRKCLNVYLLWSELHQQRERGGDVEQRKERWKGICFIFLYYLFIYFFAPHNVFASGCNPGTTSYANCDHFSIYISQLARELIFKPPPPCLTNTAVRYCIFYNPGAGSSLNKMAFFTMFSI